MDERIFLYYEARAVRAYSASLGAASGAKYAHTGWSRGYMLRSRLRRGRPGPPGE